MHIIGAVKIVKLKVTVWTWARLMWQIHHLILPPGEPSSDVPHLWSVRKRCLLQCFSWDASAAVDSAVSHLLSTSDSSSLVLPLWLPIWTHLYLIHASALPSFPPSQLRVLLSFTLAVYTDPLLITASMTAAAGCPSRSRHCWFFACPAIRKFNEVG